MRSRFLERFCDAARRWPDRTAFFNTRGESVSYAQLDERSDALAAFMLEKAGRGNDPVVVYGHKSPSMLTSFLAAAKSGHAYAPIDVAYPADRVADIVDQLGDPLVLCLADEPLPIERDGVCLLSREEVERIADGGPRAAALDLRDCWVAGDDTFYVLFTSGSTGRPKGVQMPSRCVDAFMDYFCGLMPSEESDGHQVIFNRVPYTFDVSLFDLVPGLSQGSTLFALEAECEASLARTFEGLAASGMTAWVSTPSFAEMCLADPSFDSALLPELRAFVLCGEVLRNQTALSLMDRFPDAAVFNTYGPTETQAVSDVRVTAEMARAEGPLPVGRLSAGMQAYVLDPDTRALLPRGEVGEIYLAGTRFRRDTGSGRI